VVFLPHLPTAIKRKGELLAHLLQQWYDKGRGNKKHHYPLYYLRARGNIGRGRRTGKKECSEFFDGLKRGKTAYTTFLDGTAGKGKDKERSQSMKPAGGKRIIPTTFGKGEKKGGDHLHR